MSDMIKKGGNSGAVGAGFARAAPKTMSRRRFVSATATLGAATGLGVMFGGAPASAARRIGPKSGSGRKIVAANKPHQLFEHHCKLVHKAMSDKLSEIIADPAISEEATSLAIRTTSCPCCNTRISASLPYRGKTGVRAHV